MQNDSEHNVPNPSDEVTQLARDEEATTVTPADDKTLLVARSDSANPAAAVPSDDATIIADGEAATTVATADALDKTTVAASVTKTIGAFGVEVATAAKGNPVIRERFEVLARLGKGGMGQVFKARDLRRVEARDQDPYVAIKFLGEEFSQHPDAFISLQREARKSQQLAHPNIVTVYDFDRDGDQIFMTMEYLDGRPLSRLDELEAELGKPFDRADLITQMAEGLRYAHQRGVIHSDFKPDNVFVTRDGRVKVLDFGIARLIDKTLGDDNYDAGSLGALTLRYASLEMIQGGDHQPHPADDVYALGLVGFQLLTGAHPYQGKNALESFQQKARPLSLSAGSRCQKVALEHAIQLPRARRTQSVDQFLAQFSGRNQKRRRIVAVAVLALVAVGFAAYEEGAHLRPEVPFEELPLAQQEKIMERLNNAKLSAEIGDWDGASRHYLAAYDLHPRNPDAEAGLDAFAEQVAMAAKLAKTRREVQYYLDLIADYEDHPHLGDHEELEAAEAQLLQAL